MHCPTCHCKQISKNGHHRGKQRYRCKCCGRQFVEFPCERGYSDAVKELCLKMYVNGMGFRGIERVTEIAHTTVLNWVKQVGQQLPDAPEAEAIPEIAQLDELQTFVGKKKPNSGCGQPSTGCDRNLMC
jgi:transposase-like protein